MKENNLSLKEMGRMLSRMSDPNVLHTKSMTEIYEEAYSTSTAVIDNMLYPGTYIFAGAPKVGKSFFMLQLGYHISKGIPLFGNDVNKGKVLYLALEDTFERLQSRLFKMFGDEENSDFEIAIRSGNLDGNLVDQLERYVSENQNTQLIIIDTWQKVRENGDKSSYASDYADIAKLKKFTDSTGLTLLLVHHTRKQTADDVFDMISGTNGLFGSADGDFILRKEKRTDSEATLEISGRDQPDQKLYLNRNKETLCWELDHAETQTFSEPDDPILETVANILMGDCFEWSGTPTELRDILQLDLKPNILSLKLNTNASRLRKNYGICYENTRTHDGRKITLRKKRDDRVDCDGV